MAAGMCAGTVSFASYTSLTIREAGRQQHYVDSEIRGERNVTSRWLRIRPGAPCHRQQSFGNCRPCRCTLQKRDRSLTSKVTDVSQTASVLRHPFTPDTRRKRRQNSRDPDERIACRSPDGAPPGCLHRQKTKKPRLPSSTHRSHISGHFSETADPFGSCPMTGRRNSPVTSSRIATGQIRDSSCPDQERMESSPVTASRAPAAANSASQRR